MTTGKGFSGGCCALCPGADPEEKTGGNIDRNGGKDGPEGGREPEGCRCGAAESQTVFDIYLYIPTFH